MRCCSPPISSGCVWIVVIPFALLQRRRSLQPTWVVWTNPFALTGRGHDPSDPLSPGLGAQVLFSAAALVLSAALLVLTVVRLRPVIIGQWGRAERRRERTIVGRLAKTRVFGRFGEWLGPSLDGNPVLWREWHRQRPSRWIAARSGASYLILAVGSSAVAIWGAWFQVGPGFREIPVAVNVLQVVVGLLLLSVTAATSLAEERCGAASTSCSPRRCPPPPSSGASGGGRTAVCSGSRFLPTLVAAAMALESRPLDRAVPGARPGPRLWCRAEQPGAAPGYLDSPGRARPRPLRRRVRGGHHWMDLRRHRHLDQRPRTKPRCHLRRDGESALWNRPPQRCDRRSPTGTLAEDRLRGPLLGPRICHGRRVLADRDPVDLRSLPGPDPRSLGPAPGSPPPGRCRTGNRWPSCRRIWCERPRLTDGRESRGEPSSGPVSPARRSGSRPSPPAPTSNTPRSLRRPRDAPRPRRASRRCRS